MDPIERFRMLRDDAAWDDENLYVSPHPSARATLGGLGVGGAGGGRVRWWAWAVPSFVVAAALAALAVFSLGGVLSLGRGGGPAGRPLIGGTDLVTPDMPCDADQLHAVIDGFPEGVVTGMPPRGTSSAVWQPFIVTVANTGAACMLASSPFTTWSPVDGGLAILTPQTTRDDKPVLVPEHGAAFAAFDAPFTPKCPAPDGPPRSYGRLLVVPHAGDQAMRLDVGRLDGCPLDGTPRIWPFHSGLGAVYADLHAAGWALSAAPAATEAPGGPPQAANDLAAVQSLVADHAVQQASLSGLAPCALKDLVGSVDDAVTNPKRILLKLHNTGAQACTLVGSPTVSLAMSDGADVGHGVQYARPNDIDLVKVAVGGDVYVSVELYETQSGKTASSCASAGPSDPAPPSDGFDITMPDRPGHIFIGAGIDAECETDQGISFVVQPFLHSAGVQ